jgi:hypothetical protein
MENLLQVRSEAAAGRPRAQLRLAHLILTGRTPGSPREALELVQAACERRSGAAFLYHAALAIRGHGRPQSFDEATRLVEQAVRCGDTKAKGQLMALGGKIDPALWSAPIELVQHHATPRVFTIKNFIPRGICNWLIKAARNNLDPATVLGASIGDAQGYDASRNNSVMSTTHLQPDLVFQLTDMRIAAASKAPLNHQEPTNILHYARGQRFTRHYDFIVVDPDRQPALAQEVSRIGQRAMTFLIYLNDQFEGGETEFPQLDWRFKGAAGDALMFWNLSESGGCELSSLHAGLEVTKGEKWLYSKWIRQKPLPVM